jgi:phage terminase large subunit-like protein
MLSNPFNRETHPYCYSGHQYSLDVVSGNIPNCIYVIGACKRYLSDYEKYVDEEFPRYWFDADRAEKYLRVVQKFEHVIGDWPVNFIVYEPWQNFIFMNIMGWQDSLTGFRRFRMAHIEIPRGHGKAHPVTEKVPTPEGIKEWGQIEVGSALYARDGSICRVVSKTPIEKFRVYIVKLSDGTEIKCSSGHLWYTSDKTERERKSRHKQSPPERKDANLQYETVRNTLQIRESLKKRGEINHAIYSAERNWMVVDVIETDDYEEMFCVEVDSKDHSYLVSESYVPTHNSTIASQACLYFLAGDDSKGNKVSCVATKKDQARIVLDAARAMAIKNESFCRVKGVEVRAHTIIQDSTFSEVRALSSDKNGLDGLNDVLAVCDELHAMSGEVFDLITSGMSKRKDSLILCITTAGFNTDSVGYSQSEYAKKVSLGDMIDETLFSLIFTIDKNDDIYDENTWRKANPGYGVMVDPITFTQKADKTVVTPRDLPNFKVKHLNVWINEANSYYDQNKWDALAIPDINIEDFYNKKCFIGIDLASKVDLTSIVYVFKKDGNYYVFDRSYIPEESINRNALYENCVGDGFLISTPGEAIHLPNIQDDFKNMVANFRVAEAYYDPWNATEFAQRMSKEGIEMVEFRMNTSSLSEPTKTLDALIRQKRVFHNGSPLIRWCLGNVVCKEDAAGNVFPRKNHDKLKIDPIISLIMGIAGWIREEETQSVYEDRGIRII